LKKGAKLPIKEGLHDQLHKVCMEHWNLVDQQTKSNEGKKKGKRKKKDTKTKGKKRRRNRYPRFDNNRSDQATETLFLLAAAMPKWKRSLRASWEARPRASRIQDTAMTSRKLRSTLEGAVRSIFASAMRQRSALTALLPCEGPNDFHAVQKSTTEARGEKRDRVASTLSEEDASSDSDRESAKRRRTFREDNGKPLKSASPSPGFLNSRGPVVEPN
jgi:hypothetical protein